jgi:hypothetical protein
MRYSFRLAQLLGHDPDPKKRPGTVKAIVDHTGLDRHKVAALLRNEVKYLPLDTISRLCGYLIDQGIAAPDQLPGALFAVEPEGFWELLARRTSLHMCLGMRQDPDSVYQDDAWVVTADSLLLGELLNGVSTLGGAAKYFPRGEAPPEIPQEPQVARSAPHPEEYVQWLAPAPKTTVIDQVNEKAWRVYDEFDRVDKDKALVCLGSVKSNPVVEIALARAFHIEPFVSQDRVRRARDRGVPIWLRYRDRPDASVPSCGGGFQLSQTEESMVPGIYYECADGAWRCCPWDAGQRDAALLVYHYAPARGRLEMVLGGFSSRSTRFLSQVLRPNLASRLWPPVYDTPSLQIGAYVIRFEFESEDAANRDILSRTFSGAFEVIPLDREVIARRVLAPREQEEGAVETPEIRS